MVNLEKRRVNRNLGTSGRIVTFSPSRTTAADVPFPRRRTPPPPRAALRAPRITPSAVLDVTKRLTRCPARLFFVPAVAYPLGSGILALVNGLSLHPRATPVLLESRHGTRSRRRRAALLL